MTPRRGWQLFGGIHLGFLGISNRARQLLDVLKSPINHLFDPPRLGYHLVMTNIWKIPNINGGVNSWENHLFRLGPSIAWRTVSHNQRVTILKRLPHQPSKRLMLINHVQRAPLGVFSSNNIGWQVNVSSLA